VISMFLPSTWGSSVNVTPPAEAQQALAAVLVRQQPWRGSLGADTLQDSVITYMSRSRGLQWCGRLAQCWHLP
jgi:hypothetical protein